MNGRFNARDCIVAFSLALAACGESHHMTLLQKIEHSESAATAADTDWAALSQDAGIVPVKGDGEHPFSVLSRQNKLTHFPCRNCHIDGFNLSAEAKNPRERRSHWDIELQHAPKDVMTCATCHQFGDLNFLKKSNGEAVSFDQPYMVCKSCHFQQFRDWSGGAHGKQYKSWLNPRVRFNCTSCHNPHRPAFQERWPVTYPSVPRKYP